MNPHHQDQNKEDLVTAVNKALGTQCFQDVD